MPLFESAYLTKVAASLTAGIIQQAGARFAKKLKKSEVEQALDRCGQAALGALVDDGFPDGTEIPRDHLQDVLRQFAEDDVVHDVLAGAIRQGELSPEEVAELKDTFEDAHPLETLPGFDLERAIAGFVTAFVDQADEEEAFQGLIQTKELKKQTSQLRELLDESRQQTELQREIRDHLRDAKSEGGAKALRHAYLSHTFDRLRELALSGLDPALANDPKAQMDLDAVYTALMTRSEVTLDQDSDPETLIRQQEERRALSALELLDQHDRLVLLGDPGSGKSTFVSFVALCMAGELLGREDANLSLLTSPLPKPSGDSREEPQPWSHGALLPVAVVLRHFAARGLPEKGTPAGAGHLLAFVHDELERTGLGAFADALEAELRNRGGILFLDGLDEVPEAEHRRVQLRDVVRDFAGAFPRCRILVTSRIYAYQNQDWWLGKAFHEATLAPFTWDQIRRFIVGWYAEVARRRNLAPEDADSRARVLAQAIFTNDRLLALAKRPLLLTLMASLHAWRGGTLPDKRESLYDAAVDLLLAQWERHRVVDGLMQPSLAEWLKVSQDRLHSALDELAFQAHATQETPDGTADIDEGDLLAALARVSTAAEANPTRLVEYLRDRAGLLLPRGLGIYAFPHRTFQEYLAARHLTADDFPEKVAFLARQDPERWRETVLLAGAKAVRGIPSSVWQLARELSSSDPADEGAGPADHWGALLAGQTLTESADLERLSDAQDRQRDEIRTHLLSAMRGTTLPPVERAFAGRALAVLGDPRKEVLEVDAMEFCWVPAGRFVMGSEEGDDEARPDEVPQQEIDIPYDYWVGRYPVTRAQHREFIDDGGYSQERFWEEAREDGVWNDGGMRRVDESARTRPVSLDDRWSLANHPTAGLTWYEALAFCRWLTERWRREGRLPAGWEVNLPSEPEWEKAARGGIEVLAAPELRRADLGWDRPEEPRAELIENPNPDRSYPWDGEFSADRANSEESGIGAPNAVGCFRAGASPYGCEEMAGNVWEWTRSLLWGGHPNPDEPAKRLARENLESYEPRVVRGGDFLNDARSARCCERFGFPSGRPSHYFGFRLLASPFSSDP